MKCPACDIEIVLFKKPKFRIKSIFKQVVACPYCNATIYKKANKTWEYYEQFLFVFFLIGVVLFLMAIIFGRQVGFKTALTACFYFWLIVAGVFLLIFSLNLIYIFFKKIIKSKQE